MGWVKLDDGFFLHPKAVAAGRDGRDLFLTALCWSNQQMTDGAIPAHTLPIIGALSGVPDYDQAATRLVEVGLWENDVDGWVLHDFHGWQQSRAEREEWLAKDRERKRRARELKRTETAQRVPTASARTPDGIHEDSALEKSNRSRSRIPTSSSSSAAPESAPKPAPGTDDDDELKRRVREVTDAIGTRRASRTTPRSNPQGLLATCKRNALTELGADVARLLEEGLTVGQAVDRLDGPTTTSRAAAARARRNGAA